VVRRAVRGREVARYREAIVTFARHCNPLPDLKDPQLDEPVPLNRRSDPVSTDVGSLRPSAPMLQLSSYPSGPSLYSFVGLARSTGILFFLTAG
jgi:hypothetical protein